MPRTYFGGGLFVTEKFDFGHAGFNSFESTKNIKSFLNKSKMGKSSFLNNLKDFYAKYDLINILIKNIICIFFKRSRIPAWDLY